MCKKFEKVFAKSINELLIGQIIFGNNLNLLFRKIIFGNNQIRFLVKLPNIEFELWIIQLLVVELLTEIIIKINYEC